MKVLVFSDSHGDITRMKEVIERTSGIEMVIHLGDLVKDAEKIRDIYKELKIEYIAGNNDWFSVIPKEKVLNIEGKRIFITHGDIYGVKNNYSRIIKKGQELGVDLVLFGHTHLPYENYVDNLILINPGSITLPVSSSGPTYCILEISPSGIGFKIQRYL